MERNEILKSSGYEDMKEHLRNFYKDNNYAVGNDFYMVLNSEYFNDPDPDDSLILKAGYDAKLDVTVALRNGKIASGKLRPGEIIPGYKKKPGKQSLFFFFPLSSGRFNYGYFAFKEAPVMISENLGVYDYMEKLEQTFMEYRLKMRLDEANRELSDLYNKDPLTGLYNRFCFDSIAELLYEESVGQDRPLSIMFTDINYMKKINDEHGHITGDQSIIAVADAIVNSIGPDALAVRYGGDEFIILSPDTDDAGSKAIRSQIDKNLKSLCRARKIPGKVSVSCGYVITDPKSGKTLDEYINEADKVMYAIKKEIHKED
jgi:diguanylate cyclase (GGDEF)-like protein